MRPIFIAVILSFAVLLAILHNFVFMYYEKASELSLLQAKLAALTLERNQLLQSQQARVIAEIDLAAPGGNQPRVDIGKAVQTVPDRPPVISKNIVQPGTLPPALNLRFGKSFPFKKGGIIPQQAQKQPPPQQQPNSVATSNEPRVPVLVIAYQRAEYLKKTLESIYSHMSLDLNYVIVSQDGYHAEVTNVIRSFPGTKHLQHDNTGRISFRSQNVWEKEQYYRIAQHYAWALKQVFSDPAVEEVIILEEDLEIAPDFFPYMQAVSHVLDNDHTLMTASAWNDNGYSEYVSDATRLFRSDFFPGLGWLLKRRIWNEFPEFTDAYWDDWLREPAQRKGRSCIRPEVSRTLTFGRNGASMGQFFDTHLSRIRLNQEMVNWQSQDLTYLIKATYDSLFIPQVQNSAIVWANSLPGGLSQNQNSRVIYQNMDEFRQIAQALKIMDDEKAGVPRTAYRGVVTLRIGPNAFLHISPPTL